MNVEMTGKRGVRKMGSFARRMLQGAVVVAVAASFSAAWGAGGGGGGPTLGAGSGHIQIGSVSAGSAILTQLGSVTTITTGSRNTIINYQALAVGAGETLDFVQPTSNSRVLNRISSNDPTRIDGNVWSNGRVYFVNPAGVIFGSGAVIDVNQLYASAGHLSDSDFLAGNNNFTGNAGAVQNSGLIRGQEVHLVGGSVANFGQIYTTGGGNDGIVTMTAGKDVYIGESTSPTGGPGVLVKVSGDTTGVKSGTGVTNTGTVDAGKGSLRMGAGDVYAAGIFNGGTLKGARITLDSGANTAINTGTIDASNKAGKGGTVEVLGKDVGIDGGTVDASGSAGGGVVHIGGALHGGGDTGTASRTYVDPSAVIKADATGSGNGGEVVVWSDEITRFYGNISAQGGALGGNGGMVEVSGKANLVFEGQVVTLAPAGNAGMLLLDPQTIDVNSAGTAVYTALSQADQFSDPDPGGNDRIDPSLINGAASNVTLEATGNITFTSPVSISGNNIGLTARAGGNIVVNNNITTKGGAIVLSAGDTGTSGAGSTVNGTISIDNHTLDTTGGAATGADITLRAHDVTIDPAATIRAGTGSLIFGTNVPSQTIHIVNTTADDVAGAYNIELSDLDTALQNSAKIVVGEQGAQTGAVSWDATADYNYDSVGGADRTVEIRINTSGALTMAGDLTPHGTNDHINLTLNGGAVTVSGALDLANPAAAEPGVFNSTGTSFGNTGGISDASEINILHSGAVNLQAGLDTAGGTGIIRISGTTVGEGVGGNTSAASLAIQATDNVTMTGSNGVASIGVVDTGSGKTVDISTLGGANLNTVSAASPPNGFPAFTAVSGIQTNNGNVTVTAGSDLSITNAISAGTGDVALTTVALSAGKINGTAGMVVSGRNVTLNADGGIGITSAPTLAPTGNISLTTAGAGAAGNINVVFFTSGTPGTLLASKITTLSTDAGTAQAIAFNIHGNMTVDAALAAPDTDTFAFTASGNINGDGNAAHAISGSTIDLSALGIGGTNPVSVNPTTAAVLTTTGTNATGNIRLTSTSALNELSFDTDNGTVQTVEIDNTGNLTVGANVSVETGDVLVLHAGTSGTGILAFTGTPRLKADDITLQSGIGDGSASTATVDISGGVTLSNAAGTGAPGTAEIRQDASITDEPLTTANFQGGVASPGLQLQSDGGNVTIATAANFGGSGLTLTAPKAGSSINLNTAISGANRPSGLTLNAPTINVSANVGTTGDQSYNGGVVIKQDVTLSGNNIGFGGGVDSASGQFRNLTFTATGTIGFAGDIGGTVGGGTEFGSLVVTSGTALLGNGGAFTIVTKQTGGSDGHVSFGGPVILKGNTTITATATTALGSLTSGMDDVTFASTVDSQASQHNSLTVNSPGVTKLQGNLGSAVNGQLGGVTTDNAGGALEQTLLGNGGTFSITVGSPIVFNDPVVLQANTTLNAPNGSVAFNNTVDSEASDAFTLNVQAAGGTATFGKSLGATLANGQLGGLTVSATSLSLGSSGAMAIKTTGSGGTGGAVSLDEPITLNTDLTITVSNTTAVAANDYVTLGQLSGAVNLTVDSPGVTWLKGGVGTGLVSIHTKDTSDATGTTQFGSGGAITVTTTGAQTYDEGVTLSGNTTFRGASLAFNGSPVSISAGTFDLALASDVMTFAGGANSVQGTGNLTIEPTAAGHAIVVGSAGAAANTLFLSRPTLAAIQDGFASITIGGVDETGAVTISSDDPGFAPVTFFDPVTIQSPGVGGTIVVDGGAATTIPGIYGDGNAAITLRATGITLNASVMTNGNDITVDGAVLLGTPTFVAIKSYGSTATNLLGAGPTAGNITVIGTVDDTGAATLLDVDAQGTVVGNIDLQGVIGGTTPIDGFVAAGGDLKIHGDIRTTNSGVFAGEFVVLTNTVTLAGNANPATPTTITLDTDASGGTANAGILSMAEPIDHLAGTGAVSLVIDTSATGGHSGQNITLGSVGATHSLGGLSLIAGTGGVSVADVTVTGTFSSSGAAFANSGILSASGVTVNHTGTVGINAGISSSGGAVSLTGSTITDAAASPITGLTVALSDTSGTTLNSLVTGTNGVTSTGSGALTVGGGITTTASDVTITHASGLVTLNSAISAGAGNVSITGLGITGNGAGTIGGKAITLAAGAGNVTLNAAVTGTGLFTASGAGFTNNAGVTGVGLTLNMTGLVTANAALDGGSGAVGITGDGITSVAGGTIHGGAVTLTGGSGNVTLGDTVTGAGLVSVSGAGFSNANTVTGAGITLNMTGAVAINAGLAGGSGAVGVTGTQITTAAGGTIGGVAITLNAGSGAVSLGAAVTGTGDVSVTGGTFGNAATIGGTNISLNQSGLATLNGNLNAGSGVVTINAAGVTQSTGIINGSALVLKGTGTFNLGDANTAGTLAANVTGGLTYVSAGAMTAGTAGSPSVAGITTNNGALSITLSSGALTISSAVNTGTGGLSLTAASIGDASSGLTGGAITIHATGGNATVGGAITGSGAVNITGSAISATGGVTGASATLTSAGAITSGSIATTTGDIVLTAPSGASLSGTFTSAGNVTAGAVAMTGTTSITAGGTTGIQIGAVTGGSNLTLKSTDAASKIEVGALGTGTSGRVGQVKFLSAGLVQLGGNIFAASVSFADQNGGILGTVPQAATVFADTAAAGDHTLTIDTTGTFTMAQNQKLTVRDSSATATTLGNLLIRTNHQAITVGDLSVQGQLTIDGGSTTTQVNFLQRTTSREVLPGGGLSGVADSGMDIVAGKAIAITGTVSVQGGSGNQKVLIASPDAINEIDHPAPGTLQFNAGSNTKIIPVIPSTTITGADFATGTGRVLDLIATGTSGISPSAIQGSVIPRDVQTLTPEQQQSISGAMRDALQELGIYARDLRTDEIIEYLIGRALYDDVPYKLDPTPQDTTVAANRLPYAPVLPTVDAYRQLFFAPALDDNGKPITENGKPKMAPQDSVIQRAFGETWLQYTRDKGDDATAKGFRAYLESREKDEGRYAAALSYLNQLRDLLKQIQGLGLTKTEFDVSQKVLFTKVRPPNIREEDFLDVVNGPSSHASGVAVK